METLLNLAEILRQCMQHRYLANQARRSAALNRSYADEMPHSTQRLYYLERACFLLQTAESLDYQADVWSKAADILLELGKEVPEYGD
jgi:hypothetical protein